MRTANLLRFPRQVTGTSEMGEDELISDRSLARRVFTDPFYWVAFGFGSGLAPRAPGTAGTLVGVLLIYPLSYLGPLGYGMVVLSALAAGIFICDRVASKLAQKDPAGIVLDEIVGVWIGCFLVPPEWYWLLIGFVVFRAFDILKPWPVNVLDRRLSGGLGIMMDDVAAGLYTLVVLQGGKLILDVL